MFQCDIMLRMHQYICMSPITSCQNVQCVLDHGITSDGVRLSCVLGNYAIVPIYDSHNTEVALTTSIHHFNVLNDTPMMTRTYSGKAP